MMSTTDWPPPRVIFNSEMSTTFSHQHYDEKEQNSNIWFLPCCFQSCRSRSSEEDDIKTSRLSQMLMGAYKQDSRRKSKNLLLRPGPDGSLICADHVDVNMLIEGFKEFERRFQYGTLMPFANVLPNVNPILGETILEEIQEERDAHVDSKEQKKAKVFHANHQREVIVKEICEE